MLLVYLTQRLAAATVPLVCATGGREWQRLFGRSRGTETRGPKVCHRRWAALALFLLYFLLFSAQGGLAPGREAQGRGGVTVGGMGGLVALGRPCDWSTSALRLPGADFVAPPRLLEPGPAASSVYQKNVWGGMSGVSCALLPVCTWRVVYMSRGGSSVAVALVVRVCVTLTPDNAAAAPCLAVAGCYPGKSSPTFARRPWPARPRPNSGPSWRKRHRRRPPLPPRREGCHQCNGQLRLQVPPHL